MNKIINTQNDQCFDVETNMIYLYVRFVLENHSHSTKSVSKLNVHVQNSEIAE